jgi:hypothetical protein
MTNSPFFVNAADSDRGTELPLISEGLDSVRAYQFEITFQLPGDVTNAGSQDLTLAAKQVSQVGFTVEDIEVNRVNDKVFYPGKASPEELTVTFDNLYQKRVSQALWQWFSTIYDPTTGKFHTQQEGANSFKRNATIVHLDSRGQPLFETRLYGVYPKSWKTAEFNYSTNEFHTIELGLRYDFMEHVDTNAGGVGSALPSTAGS